MNHHPFEAWLKTLKSLFHRRRHRDMTFETKRCSRRTVAIHEVAVGRVVAVSSSK
jgi:hypothetical protein